MAIIETLLEHGACVEATDEYGSTALMAAAEFGHTAAIEALVKHGANIEATDDFSSTALSCAEIRGDTVWWSRR